ncbi:MAG: protease complex subunit PrcB family protein, partial [Bdellovibrionales bacterium]
DLFLAGEDWQNPGGKTFAQIHWTGSGADATAKITIVARNQAEWKNLWARTKTEPPGPLPNGKMGVGVLLGQRPNPGYRVAITKAGREFTFGQVERLVVEYREYKPEAGKAYPQKLASPWAIRLADFSMNEVVFNEVEK